MTAVRYDVLGLGNAIVDVITRADEDFLVKHGMRKGTMSLIDEGRAALYSGRASGCNLGGVFSAT